MNEKKTQLEMIDQAHKDLGTVFHQRQRGDLTSARSGIKHVIADLEELAAEMDAEKADVARQVGEIEKAARA